MNGSMIRYRASSRARVTNLTTPWEDTYRASRKNKAGCSINHRCTLIAKSHRPVTRAHPIYREYARAMVTANYSRVTVSDFFFFYDSTITPLPTYSRLVPLVLRDLDDFRSRFANNSTLWFSIERGSKFRVKLLRSVLSSSIELLAVEYARWTEEMHRCRHARIHVLVYYGRGQINWPLKDASPHHSATPSLGPWCAHRLLVPRNETIVCIKTLQSSSRIDIRVIYMKKF